MTTGIRAGRRLPEAAGLLILESIAVVALAGGAVADEMSAGPRYSGAPFASRSPVYARHGAAATTNPLVASTAIDLLRRGGTAMDAALAANAVMGVVEPFNTGIGGDLFAIVWEPKTRRLHGYNGSGRSAAGMTLDDLRRALGEVEKMPPSGPFTVSVPGAVEAWYRLHERLGRLPMQDILAPAIAYARDGAPVGQIAAYDWPYLLDAFYRGSIAK